MITNSSEEDIKPPSNLLKDGSTIYPSFCLHAIHTDDGMNFCHPVGSNGAFPKDSRQPTFELEAAPRPGLVAHWQSMRKSRYTYILHTLYHCDEYD